ncbi:MAG: thrombospondin type 3 repeat-containing protein [Patescibacteria group bacterium]
MRDSSADPGRLPRAQKIVVIILAVLAVAIIVFWVWQIRMQVNQPFAERTPDTKGSIASSTDLAAVLKGRDTDSDGLSDYDEIYTYRTSPYLEDTDSDGLSDQQEVDQGTDPNCPQGQDCSVSAPVEPSSPTVATTTMPAADLNAAGADAAALQNALSGQVDAAALRALLISAGADPTDLEKISDADLMASYQATLNKQNQNQQ